MRDRSDFRDAAPAPVVRFVPVETEDDWDVAKAIRVRVFVEEQDCPFDEEFDEFDAEARHVLALVDGLPVATARWRVVDKALAGHGKGPTAKLERFAVLPEHRGGGLGRRLVAHVIESARAACHRRLLLHAQAHLRRFYESFGFAVEGERFEEAGIPHVLMTRVDPA